MGKFFGRSELMSKISGYRCNACRDIKACSGTQTSDCSRFQEPPLYTSVYPAESSKDLADPLRIPDAQQVITGFDLLIRERLFCRVSRGMLSEPRTWPLLYSPGLRTSTIWAPDLIKLWKSTLGEPLLNNFLKKLNIIKWF